MSALTGSPAASAPPTVLIADDNDDLRTLVRVCLGARGWIVWEAADGAEALDSCRRKAPDLVLLDVQMPHVNGWDVLAQLQADYRLQHVPVIMLTSPDGPQDVADGLDRGACDFVAKPFSPLELSARAEAALRVKRLQDDLRRRYRELDEVSRMDGLTGLANRRHVMERIPELTSAARRHGRPLAVIMIDIDHFKDINDSLGHAGGDAVLHEIASRLRAVLRKEDVAGRWGGDELIALLPFTDMAAARAAAERMWWEVRALPVHTGQGHEQKVTVSIGYAAGVAEADELLEQADGALYESKRAGRDTFRP